MIRVLPIVYMLLWVSFQFFQELQDVTSPAILDQIEKPILPSYLIQGSLREIQWVISACGFLPSRRRIIDFWYDVFRVFDSVNNTLPDETHYFDCVTEFEPLLARIALSIEWPVPCLFSDTRCSAGLVISKHDNCLRIQVIVMGDVCVLTGVMIDVLMGLLRWRLLQSLCSQSYWILRFGFNLVYLVMFFFYLFFILDIGIRLWNVLFISFGKSGRLRCPNFRRLQHHYVFTVRLHCMTR